MMDIRYIHFPHSLDHWVWLFKMPLLALAHLAPYHSQTQLHTHVKHHSAFYLQAFSSATYPLYLTFLPSLTFWWSHLRDLIQTSAPKSFPCTTLTDAPRAGGAPVLTSDTGAQLRRLDWRDMHHVSATSILGFGEHISSLISPFPLPSVFTIHPSHNHDEQLLLIAAHFSDVWSWNENTEGWLYWNILFTYLYLYQIFEE